MFRFHLDNEDLSYVSGSISRGFSLIRIIAIKVEVSVYVMLQSKNI